METYVKTVELTTTTGAKAIVTASLLLSKVINADGDKIEVPCCEMGVITADIDGFPSQSGWMDFNGPRDTNMGTIYGSIGAFGLVDRNYKKVTELISAIKSHPSWKAKENRIKENIAKNKALETQRNSHPGYCNKCGSYCYGDCQS